MSSNEILAQPPPSLSAIDRGALPTADVVARVRRVQEIMGTLMKARRVVLFERDVVLAAFSRSTDGEPARMPKRVSA